jgi:hypothetical protein
MSTSPTNRTNPKAALDYIWEQFRTWDNTSVQLRAKLAFWRRLVLALGIAGALAATLSTYPLVTEWANAAGAAGLQSVLPKYLGGLSALLLGLVAILSPRMVSPKQEGQWVHARGAAEAFKREAFLLAASAPPYDAGPSFEPAEAITRGLEEEKDLVPVPPDPPKQDDEAPPAYPLPVDDYITSRLVHQMNWYNRRAGDHQKTLKTIGGITFGLGLLAGILGVLSANWTAPLVAVITTVIATLTTYLYAWRYQYIVTSYLATARRLSALRARWLASGKTDADTADRNQLILECEGILGAENKAWVTELNRRDESASAAVANRPAQLPNGGRTAQAPAGGATVPGARPQA